MTYYSIEDFKNTDYEKLMQIIKKAQEIKKQILKEQSSSYLNKASYTRALYGYKPAYKQGFGHNPRKYYNKPAVYTPTIGTQINSILKQRKLNIELNEFEKDLLINNLIFSNDLFFINCITNQNEDNIIGELIEQVENITSENKKLQTIYRKLEIKKFLQSHIQEISQTCYRTNAYMAIDTYTITYIYNRLLQIKFFNQELYNQYLHMKKKEKKLVK